MADVSAPLPNTSASDTEYVPMSIESVRNQLERNRESAVKALIWHALEHAAGTITHQPSQLAMEVKAWMLNNKLKVILMFVGFGGTAYKAKTIATSMRAQAESFINWGRSAPWYVRFFGFVLLMAVRLLLITVLPPTSPGFGIKLQAATPVIEKWTAMGLFLASSTVAGVIPYVLDKAIQYLSPISKFRKDFMFSSLAKRFLDNWPLTCWTGPAMMKSFESVGGGKMGVWLAVILAQAAPVMGAQTTIMQRVFLPHPLDTIISQPFGMSEDLISMASAEGTTNPLLGSVSLMGLVVAFNCAEYFGFSKRKRDNALIIGAINLCIGVIFVVSMACAVPPVTFRKVLQGLLALVAMASLGYKWKNDSRMRFFGFVLLINFLLGCIFVPLSIRSEVDLIEEVDNLKAENKELKERLHTSGGNAPSSQGFDVPFADDLPNHISKDCVSSSFELAKHVATVGLGEDNLAHGFTLVIGNGDQLMSKDEDGYPHVGKPSMTNMFDGKNIQVSSMGKDFRYVLMAMGQDGAIIIDGQSHRFVAGNYLIGDIRKGRDGKGARDKSASAVAKQAGRCYVIKCSEDACKNKRAEFDVFLGQSETVIEMP